MNHRVLEQLERVAAACPWDEVQLTVAREPEGKLRFTAYVGSNEQFGFPYAFGHGDTPEAAADSLIRETEGGKRDPEFAKERKIRELQERIAKLQAVTISFPPYRPNRELAQHVSLTTNPIDV